MLMASYAINVAQACVVENCSRSSIWDRIKRGEYQSFRDGGTRKITVQSIMERRARLHP
jgi:hypothetical protein